jgi:hypothetical protein
MKNKNYVKLILLVLSIIVLSGVAAATLSSDDNQYYKWGVLLKQHAESVPNSDEIIVEAKNFTISQKEVSDSAAEWELNSGYSKEEAKKTAKANLIAKYSVYYYAKENGYEVADEHIKSVIQKMKEDVKKASNRSVFEAFLKGIEMTIDEYFDSQYENILMYETIANFKQACFTDFSKELDPSQYSQQEYYNMFDVYYNKIVRNIILGEKIKESIN